ncbi:MAG: OstA-like protein [Bacteroidota bacterium]
MPIPAPHTTALAAGLALWVGILALAGPPPHGGDRASAFAQPDTLEQDTTDADQDTTEVDILNADEAQGLVSELDGPIQVLMGNVRLQQDTTLLNADLARQYETREEILFVGNVLIIDESDSLRADTVLYNRRTKIGEASGRVTLTDGDVVVEAPFARYFTEQKLALFDQGVTLIDSAATLTSRGGFYYTEEKRAEFFEDVQLQSEATYLQADSVTYFRETEVSRARGDVFVLRLGEDEEEDAPADSLVRTLLFGRRIFSDPQAGFRRVEGDALLVQLRTDTTEQRTDTLAIRAETLLSTDQDSLRRLIAIRRVRLWQRDLGSTADSMVYDRVTLRARAPADSMGRDTAGTALALPDSQTVEVVEEEARLFQRPRAWFEDTQVDGDTLRLTLREEALDSLFVRQNAFIALLDTVLIRIQQVKGQHAAGHFEDDSLRSLIVGPTAETVVFLEEEGQLGGAGQYSCDRIEFYFLGGGRQTFKCLRGIQGIQYDAGLVPDGLSLPGLVWAPEQRPRLEGLLDDPRIDRFPEARRLLARPDLQPTAPDTVQVPPDSAQATSAADTRP